LAKPIYQQGIFLPRATYQDWGDIEVVEEKQRIIVRPKVLTP